MGIGFDGPNNLYWLTSVSRKDQTKVDYTKYAYVVCVVPKVISFQWKRPLHYLLFFAPLVGLLDISPSILYGIILWKFCWNF